MKLPHIIRVLLLLALPLSFSARGSASSLQGKVVEVLDGERITVLSLNHKLKIKLVAVAAPAKGQPYADVARQHLSDLTLGKYVVVRYTGLAGDGYLNGRILLEQADIGAQMLRDGVAWYYAVEESELAESDRQIYRDSEKAARDEGRGLWGDQNPTPPWVFRRAHVARLEVRAETFQQLQSHVGRTRSGLSSEDMMRGVSRSPSTGRKPNFKAVLPNGPTGAWVRFEPQNRAFSILVPSNSVEATEPIWENHGKLLFAQDIIGTHDGAGYTIISVREPNDSLTDVASADVIIGKLVVGLNSIIKGGEGAITARPGRDLRRRPIIPGDSIVSPGRSQVWYAFFQNRWATERQEFVLCVLYLPGFESSGEPFLTSFKLRAN